MYCWLLQQQKVSLCFLNYVMLLEVPVNMRQQTLKDDLDIKQDDFMYCGWVLLMYSSVCLYEMIACVLGGQVIGRWFWLTDHRFHLHNKEHLTHLPSRITPPSTAWAKSTRPDDLTSGMRAQLDVHQFSSLSLFSIKAKHPTICLSVVKTTFPNHIPYLSELTIPSLQQSEKHVFYLL